MTMNTVPPRPFEGKTYSLVGPDGSSDPYFQAIQVFADSILEDTKSKNILDSAGDNSLCHNRLQSLLSTIQTVGNFSNLLPSLRTKFGSYTRNVQHHRESLPFRMRWNKTINMQEERYLTAMLEIELMNRIGVDRFRAAKVRAALLPHCLRDLSADCRSHVSGLDYVCKGCSAVCNVNKMSKILRRHGVMPYIWMNRDLRGILRGLLRRGQTVGIVGVACIPELIRGMRRCRKAGIPVIGVPLDANRCRRWWGQFYPNTVNLGELERLLGAETLLHAAVPISP